MPEKKQKLTMLLGKLVKIGSKIVRHARYGTFRLAEVAVLGEGHMRSVG